MRGLLSPTRRAKPRPTDGRLLKYTVRHDGALHLQSAMLLFSLTGFQMHRTLQVQRNRLGVGGYLIPIAESASGMGSNIKE